MSADVIPTRHVTSSGMVQTTESDDMSGRHSRHFQDMSACRRTTCRLGGSRDTTRRQHFQLSLKPFKKRKLDENVYQVERVLNVRKQKGKLEFEIKWMGYEETTWEPKTNLQGEACEFSLDCIFSVLSSYKLISLLFQCKRQSIWKNW